MVVLTSVFVAQISGGRAATELLEHKVLHAADKSDLEDVRELISMYEGKNRVEPME